MILHLAENSCCNVSYTYKTHKLDFIKIKNFYGSKDTIKEVMVAHVCHHGNQAETRGFQAWD